jgi:hypothetical protein
MTEQAQQPTIKLELTLDEANAILASLGKHPFDQIAALINKIQSQAIPQLPQPEAPPAV